MRRYGGVSLPRILAGSVRGIVHELCGYFTALPPRDARGLERTGGPESARGSFINSLKFSGNSGQPLAFLVSPAREAPAFRME
jgi:hypothetical protein